MTDSTIDAILQLMSLASGTKKEIGFRVRVSAPKYRATHRK
jgi:hypothetical protein